MGVVRCPCCDKIHYTDGDELEETVEELTGIISDQLTIYSFEEPEGYYIYNKPLIVKCEEDWNDRYREESLYWIWIGLKKTKWKLIDFYNYGGYIHLKFMYGDENGTNN